MPISIENAQSYRAAGLSVLPAVRAKKCPATGRWKTWKSRLPTDCEIRTRFSNHPDAVCIIAGVISGNLEIIDFDNHGELYEKWRLTLPADLLAKLVIERTPSGGYHVIYVIYRCESEVCGNIKLAQGVRAGKAAALCAEECGELVRACNDYDESRGSKKPMVTEAIHAAATAIRFLKEIEMDNP